MSRPQRASLDPLWLEYGQIAEQTSMGLYDLFPSESLDVISLVLDRLVERLPEPERTCVSMCVMKGATYREAAEILTADRRAKKPDAPPVHRKTAHRWAQRGLDQIRTWLLDTAWLRELMAGHIPDQPTPDGTSPARLDDALARHTNTRRTST